MSFKDIPYADIIWTLRAYDRPISFSQNQAYLDLWNFLINNHVSQVPIPIADFLIALNLQHIKIKPYSTSEILLASYPELSELAGILTLDVIDKERIIRILKFLGALNNDRSIYDLLPIDILKSIALRLDCKDIKLFCTFSKDFNEYCEKGGLKELLKQRLLSVTRLNLDSFGVEELERMCSIGGTKYLSAGYYHSLVLNSKGNVFAFGGDKPDQMENIKDVIQVVAGSERSMLLGSDGRVYGLGDNRAGQLGLGELKLAKIPTVIPDIIEIVQISADRYFSLLLDTYGNVYAFGDNSGRQLGFGDYDSRRTPELIPDLDDVIQVSCGRHHSLVLKNDGTVWGFGILHLEGILGQFPTLIPGLDNIIQISAASGYSLALDKDGQVYYFGEPPFLFEKEIPTLIADLNNIIQISAGDRHSLFLDADGHVYSMGMNDYGQLGREGDQKQPIIIPDLHDIIEISSGYEYSLVLDVDGYIYSFGSDSYGNLGFFAPRQEVKIPTKIPKFNIFQ